MDTIVKKLMENHKIKSGDVPANYYKKVEDFLNYHLGSGETGAKVETIDVVEETPDKITLKVEYEVGVSYPSDDGDYNETDTEYRTQTITFNTEDLVESSDESIDSMFHEDLQKYKGKPMKELLKALSGKVKLDIRCQKPNHYGTSGYGGLANGVTWCYADLEIKEVAAGTGKFVDVYIVTE